MQEASVPGLLSECSPVKVSLCDGIIRSHAIDVCLPAASHVKL